MHAQPARQGVPVLGDAIDEHPPIRASWLTSTSKLAACTGPQSPLTRASRPHRWASSPAHQQVAEQHLALEVLVEAHRLLKLVLPALWLLLPLPLSLLRERPLSVLVKDNGAIKCRRVSFRNLPARLAKPGKPGSVQVALVKGNVTAACCFCSCLSCCRPAQSAPSLPKALPQQVSVRSQAAIVEGQL